MGGRGGLSLGPTITPTQGPPDPRSPREQPFPRSHHPALATSLPVEAGLHSGRREGRRFSGGEDRALRRRAPRRSALHPDAHTYL